MPWERCNRDIMKGELVRTVIKPGWTIYLFDDSKKKESYVDEDGVKHTTLRITPDAAFKPDEPAYLYARADGGFGMSARSLGNAIFVKHVSQKEKPAKDRTSKWSGRWERCWGIQIKDTKMDKEMRKGYRKEKKK